MSNMEFTAVMNLNEVQAKARVKHYESFARQRKSLEWIFRKVVATRCWSSPACEFLVEFESVHRR